MFLSRTRVIFKLKKSGFCCRTYCSLNKRNFKEVSIKVPWGQISGKWWEPYDKRPILSLHGWQDNCGTFDQLIPLLNHNVGFLAIDFPGHGHSSWLPQGVPYNFRYHVCTIRAIMDFFKWPKVSLLGHSMGGIMSYIFSMIFNKDVDFVICLDASKPPDLQDKLKPLNRHFVKFFKYENQASDIKEPPSYALDELIKKVCLPNLNSVLPENAKYILERNIAPSKLHKDKYYFIRDPRLKSSEFLFFCQHELVQFSNSITSPISILKAKGSSYYESKKTFYDVMDVLKKSSIDFDFHYVDGSHHVHLNEPTKVSFLIDDFIKTHNKEDRTIGGIREDIILEKRNPVILVDS